MKKKYNQINLIESIIPIVPDTVARTTYKVNTFFKILVKELMLGNRIEFRGLGVFSVRKYPEYIGRNPKTGETIKVPSKKKICFKMSNKIKKIGIEGVKNEKND